MEHKYNEQVGDFKTDHPGAVMLSLESEVLPTDLKDIVSYGFQI